MARSYLILAALGLLGLGGCVAYPVEPGYPAYIAPAPVYVAPPAVYFGGGFGGYRPAYRGHGGRGWAGRGWR